MNSRAISPFVDRPVQGQSWPAQCGSLGLGSESHSCWMDSRSTQALRPLSLLPHPPQSPVSHKSPPGGWEHPAPWEPTNQLLLTSFLEILVWLVNQFSVNATHGTRVVHTRNAVTASTGGNILTLILWWEVCKGNMFIDWFNNLFIYLELYGGQVIWLVT